MILARATFLGILFFYSLQFFTIGVNENVMNSFIHGANLIFHEAGHVIFMPFGEFMTILGGSLFQCILPFSLVFVFLFQSEKSLIGAQFALWWTGQNLTDVALYISDASERSLPLIGGMSEEAHDWGNLLSMINLLRFDTTIGLFVHYTGMMLMVLAFIWGGKTIIHDIIHNDGKKGVQYLQK